MVIFIIYEVNVYKTKHNIIYIPIWLYLLSAIQRSIRDYQADLHSNMVIFIIHTNENDAKLCREFTFQYGYIYYRGGKNGYSRFSRIYIPIWLYLL